MCKGKALIVSFSLVLFVLPAGSAEAQQTPWRYHLPIDKMTRGKDYGKERVRSSVDVEGRPWRAGLHLFCNGDIMFAVSEKSTNKPVKLDTGAPIQSEGWVFTEFRLKFDNNEPILTLWHFPSPAVPNLTMFVGGEPKSYDEMRKRVVKGMIKHRRLWIEFAVQNLSYIAKFDLTGLTHELAKCSKIPDTN